MAAKQLSKDTKDEINSYKAVYIEQYVEDVCSCSSQYGNESSILYTALNLVGKPSIYPDYGDFPQVFVMRTYGKWWDDAPSATHPIMPQASQIINSKDFVDVIFELPVFPSNVNVYETFNPGSLVRIWAAENQNNINIWHLLYEGKPQPTAHFSQIFSPRIKSVDFPTRLLRLEFDHSAFDYYTEIDAVMLAGTIPHPHFDALGAVTSRVVRLNMHNIPDEVDVGSSILTFLVHGDDYSKFLKPADEPPPQHADLPRDGCGLSSLPAEVVAHILSFLDLRALSRVAQVSRALNVLACDPLLYTEVNLKDYWWAAPEGLAALATRCRHLRKLAVPWVYQTKVPQFLALLEQVGPQLTHLRLDCSKFVGSKVVCKIGESCASLRDLSLRCCQNAATFADLQQLTRLERLDLYQTHVTLPQLVGILTANPGLKHLNIGSCSLVRPMDDVMETLASRCRGLVSLDAWKTATMTLQGVRCLASLRALEELDLGWCLGVNEVSDSLQVVAASCPRLRKLFLGACRGLTDRDVEAFVQHCPLLEQVDVVGIRSITPAVCFYLLCSCTRLKLLDVSFCDMIPDSEVYKWRCLFPKVAIKKSTFVENAVVV